VFTVTRLLPMSDTARIAASRRFAALAIRAFRA
jgi:hypothetical protein